MLDFLRSEYVDWLFIVLIGSSALFGLFRGLIRSAISLATWLVAAYAAWFYHEQVAAMLESAITIPFARYLVAVLLIVLVVVTAGITISLLLMLLIRAAGLGVLDKLGGAAFGGARGLVMSIILVTFVQMTPLATTGAWQNAQSVRQLLSMSADLKDALPFQIPAVRFTLPSDWRL